MAAGVRNSDFARAAAGRFGSSYTQLRFRVADEAKAERAKAEVIEALFYPIVNPPEGPRIIPNDNPELEDFFGPLRERPGGRWIGQMFARHRKAASIPA